MERENNERNVLVGSEILWLVGNLVPGKLPGIHRVSPSKTLSNNEELNSTGHFL